MKQMIKVFLAVCLLTACNTSIELTPRAVSLPTTAATAVIEEEDTAEVIDNDSPRTDDQNDTGLPPTFTPEPTTERSAIPTVALNELGTPVAPQRLTYTIQPGDTLAEIAVAFDVTVADLAARNDIDNINRIEVGDVLIIP